jgi:hypothetical protein
MKIVPKLHQTDPSKRACASVVPSSPTQQWLKSAQTKKRLIEGAIRCIVKFGYSKTTTLRVASEAGLSRGAMLHHFENGEALMRAVIAELNDKRLRAKSSGPIGISFLAQVLPHSTNCRLPRGPIRGWPRYSNLHKLNFASGDMPCPSRLSPNGKKTARISILHLRCRSKRLKAWLSTASSMVWTRRWWNRY